MIYNDGDDDKKLTGWEHLQGREGRRDVGGALTAVSGILLTAKEYSLQIFQYSDYNIFTFPPVKLKRMICKG